MSVAGEHTPTVQPSVRLAFGPLRSFRARQRFVHLRVADRLRRVGRRFASLARGLAKPVPQAWMTLFARRGTAAGGGAGAQAGRAAPRHRGVARSHRGGHAAGQRRLKGADKIGLRAGQGRRQMQDGQALSSWMSKRRRSAIGERPSSSPRRRRWTACTSCAPACRRRTRRRGRRARLQASGGWSTPLRQCISLREVLCHEGQTRPRVGSGTAAR